MTDKPISKLDQQRALRESNFARSIALIPNKPKVKPKEVLAEAIERASPLAPKPRLADPASVEKKKRAARGTFDRRAYMRDYMRRKAAEKRAREMGGE